MHDFIHILLLSSFRSNLRDNAQTRPEDSAGFVARPLENERPLKGTRIPTCHPWGWFSMSPGECRLYSAQRRGKGKCFTWRSNGSRHSSEEKTPRLGTIEVFSDKDGEIFQASRATKEEQKTI